jgi:PTS system nitrogen regulatory IIA component
MMDLSDLIGPEQIVCKLKANSKKHVLEELSQRAAKLTGLDERIIFNTLVDREKLGSTGLGQGIAIPHGKIPGLDKVFGMLARLHQPVDFDAVDGEPVDLVFLLLAPQGGSADHLKALARVSRMLRNAKICERLRACDSSSDLARVLAEEETSHAA